MKATYVGDLDLPTKDRDVPDEIEQFGITFEKGKAAEIPPELEAKFAGNRFFETSGKVTDEDAK